MMCEQTASNDPAARPRCSWLRLLRWGVLTGVAFAVSGCYQPYYYSPPMQTYQGPVAPIQTLTPGPSYVPGQTPANGLTPIPADNSGGVGNNGGLGDPSPFYGSNQPSSSSPAPTFEPSPSGSTTPPYSPPAGGQQRDVPQYSDPSFDDFLPPSQGPSDQMGPSDGTDFDSFKFPTSEPSAMVAPVDAMPLETVQVEPVASGPVVSAPSAIDIPDLNMALGGGNAVASIPREPIAPTAYAAPQVVDAKPEMFGHDEGSYGWLRGVVEQDPADGSWTITYDLNPSEFDDFAGHFTLSSDAKLGTLINNAVVLIEGEVSPISQDRFGKPVYEVEKIVSVGPVVR